ncbi:MAG: hypothetical protein HUJ31_12975 [Pseudomonadales bacterium]|nr:hypothetical protein [Pseudomonadales bacterium]
MKKMIFAILAILVTFAAAHAGYLQPAPLTWTEGPGYTFVGGDLKTVAYADDEDTFIGCGTRSFGDGFTYVFCQAGDADRSIYCQTENPVIVAAVGKIADSSYLGFSTDEYGECVHVAVSTQSFYQRTWQETKKRKGGFGANN